MKLNHTLTLCTKINSKWLKQVKIRQDTIKLLEEVIGKTFSEIHCISVFLGQSPKARRSNQSILKESSPEYSLEGLMLKLKLQCFGYLMRTDSLEKTLMLRKIEGTRRRGLEDEMVV